MLRAPDPRPVLRQLRPWGPLRGSERGPGSGGAPVALEGCVPSWVPAWALGECCGIRIRVRGSGSCFGECCRRISGSCGPGGRCGALSAGGISGGAPVALEGCGPSWVPAWALGECCGSGSSASGSPAAASGECCRRISGSCGPGGRCGALSAGRAPAGFRVAWKAAGSLGGILGPLRALGECCGSGSASGSPAAASGSAAEGSPAAAALGAAAGL